MENTNELMKTMWELQTCEFEASVQPGMGERITALRAKIPAPILSHYDRLGDRGKKGVALLHHQACGGCHMTVPLGVVLELQHGQDVRCCENCGRYLYLGAEPAASTPVAPEKTPRRGARKALAHAH